MVSKKKKPEDQSVYQELDFESALLELEALVSKMESGNLPLEESLREFEKGVFLSRHCQKALTSAEQRIKILVDDQEEDFKI